MENRSGARMWFAVLAVAAVAAAVGFAAYNAGVSQGLAESARFAAAQPAPGAAAPVPYLYPYPYPYMWYRPWGFGFGFFPFFFILLSLFLLRRAFWGRRWGGHYYRDGVPPRFEEWHRRAHAREAQAGSAPAPAADR